VKLIWNSGEEKARKEPTTVLQEVLPAGEHEAEVVKSESRQSPFDNVKTAQNPEGWELSLWLDVHVNGKRFRVFDGIPATHTERITTVLASAGLPVPSAGMKDFNEEVLLGRTVRIRTYLSKTTGKAKVGDYLAPKAVIEGKKAGPGKVKVDASDIPF